MLPDKNRSADGRERAVGRPHSQRAYWLCQLGGWGFYGAIQYYAVIKTLDVPWPSLLLEILILHVSGLGLTHLLRTHYIRPNDWNALRIPQLLWRMGLAAVVLAIPMALLSNFMHFGDLHDTTSDLTRYSVIPGLRPFTWLRFALQGANWAAVFAGWLLIYYFAVRSRERSFSELRQSELARALQSAELRLLKSQLNPHFLFNALNSIRSLIVIDPPRARDAITRLASMLRYTLSSSQDELVTLARELEIVNDYLVLESMRFDERLRVELDVTPAAGGVRIPVMLLQTVVENAITHGIAEIPLGGVLRIHATLQDEALVINVTNPRPEKPGRSSSEGIGLKNSAERLRLLFGAQGALELDLSTRDLATTRIRIPLRGRQP